MSYLQVDLTQWSEKDDYQQWYVLREISKREREEELHIFIQIEKSRTESSRM